jgi:prolipoprotein diacylglyceryltransferase
MGQWLSAPMIVAGAAMIVWAYRAARTARGVNRGS